VGEEPDMGFYMRLEGYLVGSHGVGSHGVGSHGVGSHGVWCFNHCSL
jgi:hypothetical protein